MHREIQKCIYFWILISECVQLVQTTRFSLTNDSRSEKRSSTLEVWRQHRYLDQTTQNGFVHVEMHRGILKVHPFRVLISACAGIVRSMRFGLTKSSRSKKRPSILEVLGRHRHLDQNRTKRIRTRGNASRDPKSPSISGVDFGIPTIRSGNEM